MIDFVGKRKWFFLLSALVIIPGLISLAIPPRLKVGLEFTGGSIQTLSFLQPVTQEDLRAEMSAVGHGSAIIQGSPKNAYLVELPALSEADRSALETSLGKSLQLRKLVTFPRAEGAEKLTTAFVFVDIEQVEPAELTAALATAGHADTQPERTRLDSYIVRTRVLDLEERQALETSLAAKFGPSASYDFDLVSAVIASERARNAAIAVGAASVAILLYITWAFRRLRHSFRYGLFTIVGPVHDTLVVVGIFSILGKVFGTEIDAMFITAILTVIGYSVHDTIVVFDRVRESTTRGPGVELETIINGSLNETLARSLNTGMTLLFMLFAMALLGGSTLRNFMLVLIIGITAGTYNSICIAPQLLVAWERRDWKKLWPFRAKAT